MILQISLWARWLDEWLQARLGRPYNALLGFGLVTEIVQQMSSLAPEAGIGAEHGSNGAGPAR